METRRTSPVHGDSTTSPCESRVANRRYLFTVAYLAATVLAPGLHVHDGADHHAPETLAGCADDGVHLAAHTDAPDLSHSIEVCPACQQQADQGEASQWHAYSSIDSSRSWPITRDPSIHPSAPRRQLGRAPPFA